MAVSAPARVGGVSAAAAGIAGSAVWVAAGGVASAVPVAADAAAATAASNVAESVVEQSAALEELLLSRTYLYTLFHKLLGAAPDAAMFEVLLGSVAAEVVDGYAADDVTMCGFVRFLEDLAARVDRAALLEEARDEYLRLFVGPGELPVCSWESPYRTNERTLFQENTLAVRVALRAGGLEPKYLERVPDDHVSLLCAFMARRAADALAVVPDGDCVALVSELRNEAAFVSAHLTNWLDAFATAIRRSKTAVLYPQLVEALAAFVQVDATFLQEAAFWIEDMAFEGAASGSLGALPGTTEAQALDTARSALAQLESARPFGIEDYELVPVQSCAGDR